MKNSIQYNVELFAYYLSLYAVYQHADNQYTDITIYPFHNGDTVL